MFHTRFIIICIVAYYELAKETGRIRRFFERTQKHLRNYSLRWISKMFKAFLLIKEYFLQIFNCFSKFEG